MLIGDKIKLLRNEKNISQVELAKKLNLTRQTISKWENNRALPDVENIILLSKFFEYNFFEVADNGINEKDVMYHNKIKVKKSMIKKIALILIGFVLVLLICLSANIYSKYYYNENKEIELVGFRSVGNEGNKVYLETMDGKFYPVDSYFDFVKTLIFNSRGKKNNKKDDLNEDKLNVSITKKRMKEFLNDASN